MKIKKSDSLKAARNHINNLKKASGNKTNPFQERQDRILQEQIEQALYEEMQEKILKEIDKKIKDKKKK